MGEIPIALATGSPKQNVNIGAGYQLSSGGEIKNMAGNFLFVTVEVGVNRYTQAFAGMIQPGAGTWKVGAVVMNTGAAALVDNDYVNAVCLVVE